MSLSSPQTRLAIIDDDLLSREILLLLASDAGFLVDAYESGNAAVDALGNAPIVLPHAILVDMQMPGLCGDPLALKLRAACGPATLLIAMSGTPVPPSEYQNFNAFLLKPFTMDDLSTTIAGATPPAAAILTSQPTAAAILNQATYASLAQTMGRPQLHRLYAMCLDDADSRIATLRQAAANRDPDAWKRAAHSIKGGCGMVGATELAAMAAEMEEGGLPAIDNIAPLEQFLLASARLRRILDAQ